MITTNLNISGIYCIINKINNKGYIGSAKNIRIRVNVHSSDLANGIHHSRYLQSSFNKYGPENFGLMILAKCPPEYLIKLEQWFLNNLKPEYNSCKIAGSTLGVKMSEESKIKNRNNKLGRKLTQQTKDKIGKAFRKKVYRYNLDGYYLDSFDGVKLAGECLDIHYQTIVNCCSSNPIYNQVGGYQWRYYKVEKILSTSINKRYKKIVLQLDRLRNFINEFESVRKASIICNINKANIATSARTKDNIVAGNYRWIYKEVI